MSISPDIQAFFDEATNTVSYLVGDPATRKAAIIDPVLDYEPKSGTVDIRSVEAVLETGARIGIGEHIKDVQRIFRPIFDAADLRTDGSDFDHLFADGERFSIGSLEVEAIYTPGHTPADLSYRIGDAVFVGDTIFMPDYGTARADFPGGDAGRLFASIQRLLALPPKTRLFMCHDYKAPGRDHYAWQTTVADQKAHNVHVHDGVTQDEFVAMRSARDAKLSAPTLLLPSIQTNIRAGRFPPAHANGVRYLAIPVTFKAGAHAF
jgi:glyoxylase-like metal-dependent hydrolase (beta-lactamase superfamily II)